MPLRRITSGGYADRACNMRSLLLGSYYLELLTLGPGEPLS